VCTEYNSVLSILIPNYQLLESYNLTENRHSAVNFDAKNVIIALVNNITEYVSGV
jgi:hypothetical protein